jgi:hypothetical protein
VLNPLSTISFKEFKQYWLEYFDKISDDYCSFEGLKFSKALSDNSKEVIYKLWNSCKAPTDDDAK